MLAQGPFYFDGAHRIVRRDDEHILDGRELCFFDLVYVKTSGAAPWKLGEIDFDGDDEALFRSFDDDADGDAEPILPTWRIRWARAVNDVYSAPEVAPIELPIVNAVERVTHNYEEGISVRRGSEGDESVRFDPVDVSDGVRELTFFADKVGDLWSKTTVRVPVECGDGIPAASFAMVSFEGELVECIAYADIKAWLQICGSYEEALKRERETQSKIDETVERSRLGGLYVVAFSSGTIKVGQSRDPNRRVREHEEDARRFGVSVVRQWISSLHEAYRESERMLIARCEDLAPSIAGREYFAIDYGFAVEAAKHAVVHAKKRTRRVSAGPGLLEMFGASPAQVRRRDQEALESVAARRLHILKAVG